jgi:integrase
MPGQKTQSNQPLAQAAGSRKARSHYGSGFLKRVGPDSFDLAVSGGKDESGRRARIRQRFRGTPAQARSRLRELIRQMERGEYVNPSKMSLADYFANVWLPTHAARVRALTHETTAGFVRWYIIPHIGEVSLAKLSREHLQTLYGRLLQSGSRNGGPLASRTVVKVHTIMRSALADAVRWEHIGRNVADQAEPPKARPAEIATLTAHEVTTILEELQRSSPWVYPLVLLAFHTGARRSELLGLRWSDVDLESKPYGAISIRRGYHRLSDGTSDITVPKTSKGSRWVPLTKTARDVLLLHRDTANKLSESLDTAVRAEDPVFADLDGRPYRPDSVTQAFRRACGRLDIRGVRFHDARHTHASLLLKTGVHVKVVSERLGHGSTLVTWTLTPT